MKDRKSAWQIHRETVNNRKIGIMSTLERQLNRVEKVGEVLNSILEGCREWDWDLPSKFQYRLCGFSDTIYLSQPEDKQAYENMLMCLTELFGEGEKKEGFSGDSIKYEFKRLKEDESTIYVEMTVGTDISGCRIIKEKTYVPEKIVPEQVVAGHWTTETKVVCE